MLKNMLSKKNLSIIAVLVLVILVVGFLKYKLIRKDAYSIVYLTTGEVYVGKLSTFPDFQLKDSYILQVTKDAKDQTKNNFQLNPINEALWAPEVLYLNKKNVVFYGPLLATSKIAETLAGQKK